MPTTPPTVEAYISSFSELQQERLHEVRHLIQSTLPQSHEKISYKMPAYFRGDQPVVYFAGWKSYVSLYPVPEGDASFEHDIAPFVHEKSTLRISYNQQLPVELLQRMLKLQWAARA